MDGQDPDSGPAAMPPRQEDATERDASPPQRLRQRLRAALPPWDQRTWTLVLVALTILTLAVGYWGVKGPCIGEAWTGQQYSRACYTDMVPLYTARGIHENQVPYLEAFNEYPVLTGMWMHAAGLMADDVWGFVAVNAAGLTVLALATTLVLCRMDVAPRHILWWALGTPLALYAFHNWDLLAVLPMMAALWLHMRQRSLEAGALLGVAVSAKLFPLLIAPVLLADTLRREGRIGTATWSLVGGAAATVAAINLPFLLRNPDLFLETYRFHLARGPSTESFWNVVDHYTGHWEWAWAAEAADLLTGGLGRILLLAGVLGIAGAVWRGRLDFMEGALGSVVLLLMLNVFFSIQYMLWILPFLALLPRIPLWSRLAVLATDLGVYITVFRYFDAVGGPLAQARFDQLALFSVLRWLALGLLLAWVVRQAIQGGRQDQAPPGPTAEAPQRDVTV